MSKGLFVGFGLGISVLLALLIYQSYNHSCPCGFKYDPFSGGCQVDLNPPPCGGQGGGNNPGNNPGSGGGSTGVDTPKPVSACGLLVGGCRVFADWKGVHFTVFHGGSTVPIGPAPAFPVSVNISQTDKDGRSCAIIKGEIDAKMNTLTNMPFNASALSGSFPMATTSASGPPTKGLRVNIDDKCRGTLTQMVAFLTRDPECGCKVSFNRE